MTSETNVGTEEPQVINDSLDTPPTQVENAKPHFIAEAISKFENKKILFSSLAVLILGGSIFASRLLYVTEQPQETTTPPVETSANNVKPESSAAEENEVLSTNLSESEARIIAENACIKGGETLGIGTYNEVTKTWWYDANLNSTQEGCNPACVVDETSQTAEINWRCTGLLSPTDETTIPSEESPVVCTADAKICPDGSAVGRIGPNCEFAPCPTSSESDEKVAQPPNTL